MWFPDSFVAEVRDATDIVSVVSRYVPLKPKGALHFGLCPFHNEKSASFSVTSEKQFYYCYGCGAGGDVYRFLMEMENYNFIEAVEHLAEQANIPLPTNTNNFQNKVDNDQKERLIAMHKTAGRFYYDCLQEEQGNIAREYLSRRQITIPVQRKFGLGYSPPKGGQLLKHLQKEGYELADILESGLVKPSKEGSGYYDNFRGRLMFPIFNVKEQVVGFGARSLDDSMPKYLNSPETTIYSKSKNLYGLHLAKKNTRDRKELIVVEGYMDMIALYQAGFKNVVASLGTAFNQDHAMAIKRYVSQIILLFDSDSAGTKAALRAIPVLVENGLTVRVLQVSGGKDPDEYIKEFGAEAFAGLLVHETVHYISFQIACSQKQYDLNNPQEKVLFVSEAAAILAKLDSAIERSVYVKEVSRMTDVDESAIHEELKKIVVKVEEAYYKDVEKQERKEMRVSLSTKRDKGILEAQRGLLYFCATYANVYLVMKSHISINDFSLEVYKKVYEKIAELYVKDPDHVATTELIGGFTDPEEQKFVVELFARQLPVEKKVDMEKSLTEMVRMVRKNAVDTKITDISNSGVAADDEILMLMREKTQIDKISIVL
ncbi:MAG: DNA primase [Bacillota bacterium]